MARPLLVVACLALAGGAAMAGGKTSKVTIETDPPGAKVYFGLKEDGEVCTTPCTVDAPIGETPIIVEAENRRAIIENLIVPKKTARPLKVSYKLEPAIGTLVVEGADGATIKIDDEDKGKAPGRIEGVLAGAHHVVVEKHGKPVYDEFVEIEAGHEATVTPPTAPEPARPDGGEGGEAIAASATPRPARRRPAIAVTGTFDFGMRWFTFDRADRPADNGLAQHDNSEVGQLLAGPIIELWPTALAGLDVLPGLALYGRFEFGLNSQQVVTVDETSGAQTTSLSTSWQSLELSARYRWMISSKGTVEASGGYAQDRYGFDGNPTDVGTVPDANYKVVRIGGRGSVLLGPIEPYVAIENRVVLSGGAMDQRYRQSPSTNGFHGALGAAIHLGSFETRVESGLTRYSWTFKAEGNEPEVKGGLDQIVTATLSVGYAY
ncbi:MAG TPA: PEGA domain-containing protein [Kofleriaceae bacterium]|nr:PEGA domain-containing protein [Kofleriaceae bacterium]